MYEKILVADDEEGMVSFLKDALASEGYEVITVENGEEAVKKALNHPDLIILDILMPGKDGYEVCQAIRDIVACPILFLSALQSEADRIKGLALGGDDYIIKPFSIRELKMRIQAHLRRETRAVSLNKRSFLRYGNLAVDIKGHEVYFRERQVAFTRREFDIIAFLSLHPGIIFSRDQIYERIWGYDATGDSVGVVEHIKKIRSKLEYADPGTEYISTVWGVGYKWERIR